MQPNDADKLQDSKNWTNERKYNASSTRPWMLTDKLRFKQNLLTILLPLNTVSQIGAQTDNYKYSSNYNL